MHPTFQEPDIRIDDAALDAWKSDQLESVETVLTATISTTPHPDHHALATRALVRTRLQDWDTALADAEEVCDALLSHTPMLTLVYPKSIKLEPSVIGYIAKSLAHVGKGEKYDGYRACDIAFERFHSTHVSFILLIKVGISCTPVWLILTSLYRLGYHRIHRRRQSRCDITRRRPHHYGTLQFDMLCGPGTCKMYSTAIRTDISS